MQLHQQPFASPPHIICSSAATARARGLQQCRLPLQHLRLPFEAASADSLVGKASSVAHQKHILWRMGGAPQNSRHKNKASVAHQPMRHRKLISVAHRAVVRHRNRKSYFCGAPPPVRHRIFFKISKKVAARSRSRSRSGAAEFFF
jgi:hypothetical protein